MSYYTLAELAKLRTQLAAQGIVNTDDLSWKNLLNGIWKPRREGEPNLNQTWDELKEYLESLGQTFDESKMGGRDKLVEDEAATFKTPIDFYKRGWQYLYHLTAFDLDQWKRPYFQLLGEHVKPCGVLDYGCGIGADGLRLAESGFTPAFADYKSRCTDYLRWRIKQRGVDYPVYDVEKDDIPRHDLVVSFDVIEHVDDVPAYLRRVAELGKAVAFNMPHGASRSTLHYEVDVEGAMKLIAELGTVRLHRVVNAFQHFVIFDSEFYPEPEAHQEVEENGSDLSHLR